MANEQSKGVALLNQKEIMIEGYLSEVNKQLEHYGKYNYLVVQFRTTLIRTENCERLYYSLLLRKE